MLPKCTLCENLSDPRMGVRAGGVSYPLCDGCSPDCNQEDVNRVAALCRATASAGAAKDVAGSIPAGVSTVAGSRMPEGERGVEPSRQEAEGSRKSPHSLYVARRIDGWPLCPGCGEDELYSLELPEATEATIAGCYRCPWKPPQNRPGSRQIPVTASHRSEALQRTSDARTVASVNDDLRTALNQIAAWALHDFERGQEDWALECSRKSLDGMRQCGYRSHEHPLNPGLGRFAQKAIESAGVCSNEAPKTEPNGEHYKQLWDDSCRAVVELCLLAGAKRSDMPDLWTLEILIKELKSDVRRLSEQAERVTHAWEEDPTSFATENAINELKVRTPAVPRSDKALPSLGQRMHAHLEKMAADLRYRAQMVADDSDRADGEAQADDAESLEHEAAIVERCANALVEMLRKEEPNA